MKDKIANESQPIIVGNSFNLVSNEDTASAKVEANSSYKIIQYNTGQSVHASVGSHLENQSKNLNKADSTSQQDDSKRDSLMQKLVSLGHTKSENLAT